MCDINCCENPVHSEFECQYLSSRKVQVNNPLAFIKCVLPLRMSILKLNQSESYEKLNLLMDHNDVRIEQKSSWNAYQSHVVAFLRNDLQLELSEDEINRHIGIIRTNSIETKNENGEKCRSLYANLSLLSHSCFTNAR